MRMVINFTPPKYSWEPEAVPKESVAIATEPSISPSDFKAQSEGTKSVPLVAWSETGLQPIRTPPKENLESEGTRIKNVPWEKFQNLQQNVVEAVEGINQLAIASGKAWEQNNQAQIYSQKSLQTLQNNFEAFVEHVGQGFQTYNITLQRYRGDFEQLLKAGIPHLGEETTRSMEDFRNQVSSHFMVIAEEINNLRNDIHQNSETIQKVQPQITPLPEEYTKLQDTARQLKATMNHLEERYNRSYENYKTILNSYRSQETMVRKTMQEVEVLKDKGICQVDQKAQLENFMKYLNEAIPNMVHWEISQIQIRVHGTSTNSEDHVLKSYLQQQFSHYDQKFDVLSKIQTRVVQSLKELKSSKGKFVEIQVPNRVPAYEKKAW